VKAAPKKKWVDLQKQIQPQAQASAYIECKEADDVLQYL